MKKAKITAALLAASLALGLTACGGKAFDYNKVLDENGFFKGVTASEIVTLPEYKGIDVNKSVVTVTEDQINEQIAGLLEQNPQYVKITDRAVVDGDKLNIDYVGSVNGVEFAGGTTGGMGTVVTIGVTNFIDDFLYQLIGHNPGETVNVEVTFPEDYGNPELNGKDALFVTKINYICGEQVNVLTDETAKSYGFDTKEQLLEDIEKWLYESHVQNFVSELLTPATVTDVPKEVLDFVIESEFDYMADYVMRNYGMTAEQYLVSAGYASKNAYIDDNMDSFKTNAALYLAFQAIAEKEGLTVTDADLTEAGLTEEDMQTNGKPYYKQSLLMTKIVPDFIVANANVVEDMTEADTSSDNTEETAEAETTAAE